MEPTSHEHLVHALLLLAFVLNVSNMLLVIIAMGSSARGKFARAAFLWRMAATLASSILLSHIIVAALDPSKALMTNFVMGAIIIFFSMVNARANDRKAVQPPPS
jgi:hypothetical protein